MTLRIERSQRQGCTVFTLIGHLEADYIAELENLFGPPIEGQRIIVDLSELRLSDRAGVRFLGECKRRGIELENCPAYIREWIERESLSGDDL
jgi:anti-anti-sigma regulatory factor